MHTEYVVYSTGKPHSHPDHPDYVPSIFPSVYKKPTPIRRRVVNRQQNVVTIDDTTMIAQMELGELKDTMEVERQKLMKYMEEEKKDDSRGCTKVA